MVGAIGAVASCAFALAGRDYARSTLRCEAFYGFAVLLQDLRELVKR
jgi:hypothetical protein